MVYKQLVCKVLYSISLIRYELVNGFLKVHKVTRAPAQTNSVRHVVRISCHVPSDVKWRSTQNAALSQEQNETAYETKGKMFFICQILCDN